MFVLNNAKNGYENIERFLVNVERGLPKESFQRRRFNHPNKKNREIQYILINLKKSETACVPTKKSNWTHLVLIFDYKYGLTTTS